MKSGLSAVLCWISLVAIWGIASAEIVDNEDVAFCTDSLVSGLEGGAIPSRIPKTGQTTSYGPRDDGKLQKGRVWPNPRFTDNGNGTVRDNLTGLIWLKNANCKDFYAGDLARGSNWRNWFYALNGANALADGYCGLTDGSKPGQWRLPNVRELYSLIDSGFPDPALPNTEGTGQWTEGDPFTGVRSSYWSSTTSVYYTSQAVSVCFGGNGWVSSINKNDRAYVWAVR